MLTYKWLTFQLCSSAIVSVGVEQDFCTFWKWDKRDFTNHTRLCPVEIVLSIYWVITTWSAEEPCLCNCRKTVICLCCLNVYIKVFQIMNWEKAILKRAVHPECDLWASDCSSRHPGAPETFLWWHKPLVEKLTWGQSPGLQCTVQLDFFCVLPHSSCLWSFFCPRALCLCHVSAVWWFCTYSLLWHSWPQLQLSGVHWTTCRTNSRQVPHPRPLPLAGTSTAPEAWVAGRIGPPAASLVLCHTQNRTSQMPWAALAAEAEPKHCARQLRWLQGQREVCSWI